MAARPRARIIRVLSAASADTVRWSLAVVPLAAVAFAGPWFAMFALEKVYRNFGQTLLLLIGGLVLLGSGMQSALLELGAAALKPGASRWRADLWPITRRFAIDLGLNLIALALVCAPAGLFAVAGGVLTSIVSPKGDAAIWVAAGGGVFGGVLATFLMARWTLAPAAAHIESLGLVEALQRSTVLTHGHRLGFAAIQAVYLCAWPGLFFAAFYLSHHATELGARRGESFDEATLEIAFGLLGLLASLECFAKIRLYRELATLDGEVGQSRVLEVFS